MSDEVVNKYIYSEVIIPSTLQNREILLTTHSPAERYQMIAIAQDGANGQIQAIENYLHQMCEENAYNIMFEQNMQPRLLLASHPMTKEPCIQHCMDYLNRINSNMALL